MVYPKLDELTVTKSKEIIEAELMFMKFVRKYGKIETFNPDVS